jgi:adenylate kinase family enzyme
MRVFQEQTASLLDYYRQKELLVEINGEQTVEAVHQDLVAEITKASY